MGTYRDIEAFRRATGEDLTEECDRCGEVYTAEAINAYLRDERGYGHDDEVLRVCCSGVGRTRSPRTQEND